MRAVKRRSITRKEGGRRTARRERERVRWRTSTISVSVVDGRSILGSAAGIRSAGRERGSKR